MTHGNNKIEDWDTVTKFLHWLSAIIIISLFILGVWMTNLDYYSKWYHIAPDIHKSVGLILLAITIFRLPWRLINTTPKPLANHTKLEIRLSNYMQVILYLLIFSIIISGYLISTADGRSISIFGFISIPAVLTKIPNQATIMGTIHMYLAYIVIALVFIHSLAACKHHYFDKDNTLKRML